MTKYELVIAPVARDDLKDIYQYGCRHWGKVHSEGYLAAIKDQIWMLTEQPFLGVERPELLANIRSLPIQSHTLFYRVASSKVEIIRVLHGRQDSQRHLKPKK